jgi:hypothetical protein
VLCSKVPSQHLPGSLMELSQNSQQSSSNSTEEPSKYKVGILTITPLYETSGSHSGKDFNVGFLGCNATWTCRLIQLFQRNTPSPTTQKMEIACFPKMLVLSYKFTLLTAQNTNTNTTP